MKLKKLSLQEAQQRLAGLLKEFKQVCEEHNLRYYVGGGTLLGAIRHKGFIPWDDDIDIGMPRPDYIKLIELQKNGLLKNTFFCIETDKKHKMLIGRYSLKGTYCKERLVAARGFGVYLDIFPYDGLGDNLPQALKTMKKIDFCSKIHWALISPFRPIFLIPPLTPLFFMEKYFRHKLNKMAKQKSYEDCDYVGTLSNGGLAKEILPKDLLGKGYTITFENEQYTAPEQYKKWLIQHYGKNYITPPPENKRQCANTKTYYDILD